MMRRETEENKGKKTQGNNQRQTNKGKQTKGNKHRKGKKQRPPALSQRRRT